MFAVMLQAAHTCVILLQLLCAAPWTLQVLTAASTSVRKYTATWLQALRSNPNLLAHSPFNFAAVSGKSLQQPLFDVQLELSSSGIGLHSSTHLRSLSPIAKAAIFSLHQVVGEWLLAAAVAAHICYSLTLLLGPVVCIAVAAYFSSSSSVAAVCSAVMPVCIAAAMACIGVLIWFRAVSLFKDAVMLVQGEPVVLDSRLWPVREDLNPYCGCSWLNPRKMNIEVSASTLPLFEFGVWGSAQRLHHSPFQRWHWVELLCGCCREMRLTQPGKCTRTILAVVGL